MSDHLKSCVRTLAFLACVAVSAPCRAEDVIAVISPAGPVIVARGEPIELQIQVSTEDFVGTAWYRAEKRPPGARAYRAEVAGKDRGQKETFAFQLDTTDMPAGDYTFLFGGTRLSKQPMQAQARATVTLVEKAPIRITKPVAALAANAPVVVVAEGDPAFQAAGVTIMKDGEPAGEQQTATFTYTWDLSAELPGPHTLCVVARDAAGRTYTTRAIAATVPASIEVVGVDPARVYFAQPQNASLQIGAKTEDDGKVEQVEYYLDGAKVAEALQAPWNAALDCSAVPDGTHVVAARAVLAGAKAWASAPVFFSLVNFNVDPELADIRLRELVAEAHRTDRYAGTGAEFWVRYRASKRLRAVWLQRLALGLKVGVTYAASGDASKKKGAGCVFRDVIYEAGLDSAYGAMAVQLAKQYGLSLASQYRSVRRRQRKSDENIETDFLEYDMWMNETAGKQEETPKRTERQN